MYMYIVYSFCRKLQHPNIVQVMGVEQKKGELFIMMALVDGPNLHDLIFGQKYKVTIKIMINNYFYF